jgi:hypothetical protein
MPPEGYFRDVYKWLYSLDTRYAQLYADCIRDWSVPTEPTIPEPPKFMQDYFNEKEAK